MDEGIDISGVQFELCVYIFITLAYFQRCGAVSVDSESIMTE
jgi:hypothetical protein